MERAQLAWIRLVNAQRHWTTDEAMLAMIPETDREFDSAPAWPLARALAFFNNNVTSLRLNYEHLEAGETLDLDLLNPVLDGITLRILDVRAAGLVRRDGVPPSSLRVVRQNEGWNRGTAALRHLVQQAVHAFARYVDLRLRDPAWPGATMGILRVLPCSRCGDLVTCPTGRPRTCPGGCSPSPRST